MEAVKLRSILTCPICERIFENPVILPCNKTICKSHLASLYTSETQELINCSLCLPTNNTTTHPVPGNGFPLNEDKQVLIELKLDKLNLDELNLRREARANCEEFEKRLNEIELLIRDPGYFINEYFDRLTRITDLRRDQLKNEIDDLFDNLKENITQLETSCYEGINDGNCLSNICSMDTVDELKNELNQWLDYLGSYSIDEAKWKEILNESESKVLDLDERIRQYKNRLLLCKNYLFLANDKTKLNSEFIGRFIVEDIVIFFS
jgi:hypothetical protein